jgi:hypothetical protein
VRTTGFHLRSLLRSCPKGRSRQYVKVGSALGGRSRFPLTPALSLSERENRRQIDLDPHAVWQDESQTQCLPLPEGEGRGEEKAGNRFAWTVLCESLRLS